MIYINSILLGFFVKLTKLLSIDPNFIADLDKSNLDYTLRSPITGNPTMNNAKDHPMKLAVNARHEKVTKYLPSHVIPLVNIWPGLMDKETEAFLDRLCSYIKQLDSLPLYNIKQFILKRIAFVLFKGFANNVIYNNRRLYNTFSDPVRNQDFNPENIIASTNTNQIYNNNHFISNHQFINTNKTIIPCNTVYQYTSRVRLSSNITLVH